MAEQRGAWFIRSTRYMRLAPFFMGYPSPLIDADDSLPSAHVDVLNTNALLTGCTVALQSLRLSSKGASQLVQHVACGVPLLDGL